MADWEFDTARADVARASVILHNRDRLAEEIAPLDLEVPAAFEASYEDADDLAPVLEQSEELLDAGTAIATADDAVDGGHSFFEIVGLIGSDADDALGDARDAFAAGDGPGARADAARAVGTVARADVAGKQRVAIAGWAVRTPEGAPAVLKFAPPGHLDFDHAGRVCARLRARGYPAPAYLHTGRAGAVAFGVTELLPGRAMTQAEPAHVTRVVALVDRQRGIGLPGRRPWVDDMVTSVTDGRDGYCEHAAMAAYSPATRALLDRLVRVAGTVSRLDVALDDVMHIDLSPFNVLVDGPVVTGVVDWEGSTTGDAAFDLVTLAM
jgi:hypothetical protein